MLIQCVVILFLHSSIFPLRIIQNPHSVGTCIVVDALAIVLHKAIDDSQTTVMKRSLGVALCVLCKPQMVGSCLWL